MDGSMRMVFVAGILMLALLVAVIGSVSADSVTVHAKALHPVGHQL